jgi:ABC-type dipeptide/oligopeptide/nickel transport system ATPase component
MNDASLAIDRLTVVFPEGRGKRSVLHDLSLSLRAGESIGLVAPSGSGKSVLVWTTVGLLPPPGRVVGGSVWFEGQDLLGLKPEAVRRIRGKKIGLIAQNARAHLNPLAPIGKQIAEVYRAHSGASQREALEQAAQLLRLVAFGDPERQANSYPHELSGGMAQRVLIAMAIVHEPLVLLADEPTMGLDVTIQRQVLDLFRSQIARLGSSALLVTRDMGIVANYCQRVAIMHEGAILEIGPTEAVLRKPRHAFTVELLRAASLVETAGSGSGVEGDTRAGTPGAVRVSSEQLTWTRSFAGELVEVEADHLVRMDGRGSRD